MLPTWDDPVYGAPNANWTIAPDSIIIEKLYLEVVLAGVSRDNSFLQFADSACGDFIRPEGGGEYGATYYDDCPTELPPDVEIPYPTLPQ